MKSKWKILKNGQINWKKGCYAMMFWLTNLQKN